MTDSTTTTNPTPYDDVIDSRDVIAAIDGAALHLPESDALTSLIALAQQGSDATEDWEYGATIVRGTYFPQYAMDIAYDGGMVPDNLSWPLSCIDWEQAAWELRMDYTPVEFDGVAYWVR